jgi:hypothetical protein
MAPLAGSLLALFGCEQEHLSYFLLMSFGKSFSRAAKYRYSALSRPTPHKPKHFPSKNNPLFCNRPFIILASWGYLTAQTAQPVYSFVHRPL